jgi:hypothetical protein
MANNLEPIHGVIARVRRAMPRNGEVMLICDELEKSLMVRSSAVEQRPLTPKVVGSNPTAPAKQKLSRAQIQKNYRQRQRAKEQK